MPQLVIDATIDVADLYTIDQAYPLLGVSRMTLFRWLKAHKIYAFRLGNRVLIPKLEIERLRQKVCLNCYHHYEWLDKGKEDYCCCRDKEDIIIKPNSCQDWFPTI